MWQPVNECDLIRCRNCGHRAVLADFYFGRGRAIGEHPDHRYCPHCSGSITWCGYERARGTQMHGSNDAT